MPQRRAASWPLRAAPCRSDRDGTLTEVPICPHAELLAIPNTELAGTRIENFTRMDEGRRGLVRLQVALDTDLKLAGCISAWMKEAAEAVGLSVVWCHLDTVDEKGIHFALALRGPKVFATFHELREKCTLRILAKLQFHGVKLTRGMDAQPIGLKA